MNRRDELEFIAGCELTFLEGREFDVALMGVSADGVAVYEVNEILRVLRENGMDHLEAEEWFDFNIAGAHVGEKTPIYVWAY